MDMREILRHPFITKYLKDRKVGNEVVEEFRKVLAWFWYPYFIQHAKAPPLSHINYWHCDADWAHADSAQALDTRLTVCDKDHSKSPNLTRLWAGRPSSLQSHAHICLCSCLRIEEGICRAAPNSDAATDTCCCRRMPVCRWEWRCFWVRRRLRSHVLWGCGSRSGRGSGLAPIYWFLDWLGHALNV